MDPGRFRPTPPTPGDERVALQRGRFPLSLWRAHLRGAEDGALEGHSQVLDREARVPSLLLRLDVPHLLASANKADTCQQC